MLNPCNPKNVVLFISNKVISDLYHEWIIKELQPHCVARSCASQTASAFTDLTQRLTGKWDVLLVHSTEVEQHQELLEKFIKGNPGIRVGIVVQKQLSSSILLTNAILLEYPASFDEWLVIMHQLVEAVTSC